MADQYEIDCWNYDRGWNAYLSLKTYNDYASEAWKQGWSDAAEAQIAGKMPTVREVFKVSEEEE